MSPEVCRLALRRAVLFAALGIVGLALSILFSGCGTVAPKPSPEPGAVAFDGNDQNAGIIGYIPGRGWEVTSWYLNSPTDPMGYEVLAKRYGYPPSGAVPYGGHFIVTSEVAADKETLLRRKREEGVR